MKIFCFLSLLLILSCNQKSFNRSENSKNYNRLSDSLETGYWIEKNNNYLKSQGNYVDGLKFGKWSYFFENDTIVVDWQIKKDTLNNYNINYLADWKLQKNENSTIYLAFLENYELIFIEKLPKNVEFDNLENWTRTLFNGFGENEEVEGYILKKGNTSKRKFYFLQIYSQVEQTNYIVYSFLTEDKKFLYNFGYRSVKDERTEKKLQFYIDMIYSSFMEGERLFYPEDNFVDGKQISIDEI